MVEITKTVIIPPNLGGKALNSNYSGLTAECLPGKSHQKNPDTTFLLQ